MVGKVTSTENLYCIQEPILANIGVLVVKSRQGYKHYANELYKTNNKMRKTTKKKLFHYLRPR